MLSAISQVHTIRGLWGDGFIAADEIHKKWKEDTGILMEERGIFQEEDTLLLETGNRGGVRETCGSRTLRVSTGKGTKVEGVRNFFFGGVEEKWVLCHLDPLYFHS